MAEAHSGQRNGISNARAPGGPLVELDANDLGNHVTGPPDDHRVPDLHILAPNLVFVVQRRIGHRHAADEDRLKARDRRDGPGAPDLDVDAQYFGGHLLGRIFVRHRPARLARHEPQLVLQRQRIDLVDDAVDFEGELRALARDRFVESRELERPARNGAVRVDRKAERFERVLHLALRRGPGKAPCLAETVREELQRPLRRHRRIDLAHRPRGRVARIDEEPAAGRLLPGIQVLEVAPRHVDLAAHLEERRGMCGAELARDRADRPDVRRDVLADLTVAARRRDGQAPVFVAEADRKAVELELGQVLDRRRRGVEPELAAHPRIELGGGSRNRVGLRSNRQHRHRVANRGEVGSAGGRRPSASASRP